ncbi:MAG: hypothetical protein WBP44_14810, partial [Gammaproteobacteria bacterium]
MRFTSLKKSLPVIVMAISVQGHAAEWTAAPDISLRSGYNDNYRLTSAPHSSVWESVLSASSRFGVAKENQGLFGVAGVRVRRFWGGTGLESSDLLNREDYYFNTNAYHQTELNVFSGNINFIRDSLQGSVVDETGDVSNADATRISKSLGTSWARTLTERTSFDLGYRYNKTSYTDTGDRFLIPYKFNQLTASLNYQVTPRTVGILQGSGRAYKPDTGLNSNTWNIQAGFNSAFSETINLSILAGYRKTKSDSLFLTGFCVGANPGASFPDCDGGIPVATGTDKGETKTSGSVYNASITKRLEKGSLSATLSRSTSPGQNGQLLDSNQLRLNGVYGLTDMLQSSLGIQYSENETIVNVFGRDASNAVIQNQDNTKRKFFRISPRI